MTPEDADRLLVSPPAARNGSARAPGPEQVRAERVTSVSTGNRPGRRLARTLRQELARGAQALTARLAGWTARAGLPRLSRVIRTGRANGRRPDVGTLRRTGGGRRLELEARAVVGRSRSVQLVLDDSQVSREHAVAWWENGKWRLRDLNSLNGTWVDGRRLSPGVDVVLEVGSQVTFGAGEETWTVECTAAPSPEGGSGTDGSDRE